MVLSCLGCMPAQDGYSMPDAVFCFFYKYTQIGIQTNLNYTLNPWKQLFELVLKLKIIEVLRWQYLLLQFHSCVCLHVGEQSETGD